MGTLNKKMLRDGRFLDERDARTELFAHIDSYLNTHRKHSPFRNLSPTEFAAKKISLN